MRNLLPAFQEADFRQTVKYYMDQTDELECKVESLEKEVSALKKMTDKRYHKEWIIVTHSNLCRDNKKLTERVLINICQLEKIIQREEKIHFVSENSNHEVLYNNEGDAIEGFKIISESLRLEAEKQEDE
jgi:hypothetical protein